MADNIIKFSEEFKDKTIAVLTGFEHKYYIVNLLKEKDLLIKNFWEF